MYLVLRLGLFALLWLRPLSAKPLDPLLVEEDKNRASLSTLAEVIYILESSYVDPKKAVPSELVKGALHGISESLDPHTMIMDPKSFEKLTDDTKGQYGGVGIIVTEQKGHLVIVSTLENTPAAKAGLKSDDEIIEIDGIPVGKLKSEAVDKMAGLPGTSLKLKIKRKKIKETLSFSLTREIIKVRSVVGESLGQGIYYTRISSFQEATSESLATMIESFGKGIRGLILDLRDNPGGLLMESVKVADLFLESGLIVSTIGRDPDRIEREFAHKKGTLPGFPMVTLINGGSASASEIVAGALQDHKRSIMMGTQTFGKGSVQTLIPLPDGGGAKVTIALHHKPNGDSIQAKGITPDLIVPLEAGEEANAAAKDAGHSAERKEADLKGHIVIEDQSKTVDPLEETFKAWKKDMQEDNQVIAAFKHLHTWVSFQSTVQMGETKS